MSADYDCLHLMTSPLALFRQSHPQSSNEGYRMESSASQETKFIKIQMEIGWWCKWSDASWTLWERKIRLFETQTLEVSFKCCIFTLSFSVISTNFNSWCISIYSAVSDTIPRLIGYGVTVISLLIKISVLEIAVDYRIFREIDWRLWWKIQSIFMYIYIST